MIFLLLIRIEIIKTPRENLAMVFEGSTHNFATTFRAVRNYESTVGVRFDRRGGDYGGGDRSSRGKNR